MADNDDVIDPEDINSEPSPEVRAAASDPNDEIPVPGAMEPAEIDERAQVVEALRARNRNSRGDDGSKMEA